MNRTTGNPFANMNLKKDIFSAGTQVFGKVKNASISANGNYAVFGIDCADENGKHLDVICSFMIANFPSIPAEETNKSMIRAFLSVLAVPIIDGVVQMEELSEVIGRQFAATIEHNINPNSVDQEPTMRLKSYKTIKE